MKIELQSCFKTFIKLKSFVKNNNKSLKQNVKNQIDADPLIQKMFFLVNKDIVTDDL